MIKLTQSIKDYHQEIKNFNGSIGLVPTMGNLHDAHLNLIKTSLGENELSVVTIFVNPLQFGKGEDFESYPRTLDEDIKKIATLVTSKENIIVFSPKTSLEIFPRDFSTTIKVGPIGGILEGEFRPTHFEGVATVVYRLLSLFKPTHAYFGKKDYQQLLIIKKMVKDLEIPVRIKSVEIGREKSGLAMSSRNSYLSSQQKKEALKLRTSILKIKRMIKRDGLNTAKELLKKIKNVDNRFNYLELRNAKTLAPITHNTKNIVILGTYQIEKTRLLDNETVEIK